MIFSASLSFFITEDLTRSKTQELALPVERYRPCLTMTVLCNNTFTAGTILFYIRVFVLIIIVAVKE